MAMASEYAATYNQAVQLNNLNQLRREKFISEFKPRMKEGNPSVVYDHLKKKVRHSHHIYTFVPDDLLCAMRSWLYKN